MPWCNRHPASLKRQPGFGVGYHPGCDVGVQASTWVLGLSELPGRAGRSHRCHSSGLVHRLRSQFPHPQRAFCGRAGSGFSPVFCPSVRLFRPASWGGVFLLFRGIFRGGVFAKLLFTCYSATRIRGFFGLPRRFLPSGDEFRNVVHSDLRRRPIYICMNKVVRGVWFYGLRARTHRITVRNVE